MRTQICSPRPPRLPPVKHVDAVLPPPRFGLSLPRARENQRYGSFRTTAARAGFCFSEDAPRNATANSTATQEFWLVLLGRGFHRTKSDRPQTPRALSRLDA